jgi:hypothetical protein
MFPKLPSSDAVVRRTTVPNPDWMMLLERFVYSAKEEGVFEWSPFAAFPNGCSTEAANHAAGRIDLVAHSRSPHSLTNMPGPDQWPSQPHTLSVLPSADRVG